MTTIFQPRFAVRALDSVMNDRPVAVSYFVTNRCNFTCDFCSYPTFNTDKKRELSPAEIEGVGAKLASAGVAMVAVIGGEPFVRRDLAEVVAALARNLLVQVTTNGWMVDPERAAELFAAGAYMVNVSLDSARPEVHDAGRGQPGAFERALRAVQTLRDAPKIASDQLVGFECILGGRNFHEVEAMLQIAQDLGVRIVFQPYSGGHTDVAVNDLAALGGDPTARFLELKQRYTCLYNHRPMIEGFTPFFRDGLIPDCGAGRTYFNVDAYGNITRCEEQRTTYGNLRHLDREGVRAALAHIVDDTRADGCAHCWLRTRGETEPLYRGDLAHFVEVVEAMFGFELPAAVRALVRVPGARQIVRAGASLASRAGLS